MADAGSVFVNDGREPSFIAHYYHFTAEVLVGGISALSATKTRHHQNELLAKPPEESTEKSGRRMIGWFNDRWLGYGRNYRQPPNHESTSGTMDGNVQIDWAVTPWEGNWHDGPGLNQVIFDGLFGKREMGVAPITSATSFTPAFSFFILTLDCFMGKGSVC